MSLARKRSRGREETYFLALTLRNSAYAGEMIHIVGVRSLSSFPREP